MKTEGRSGQLTNAEYRILQNQDLALLSRYGKVAALEQLANVHDDLVARLHAVNRRAQQYWAKSRK